MAPIALGLNSRRENRQYNPYDLAKQGATSPPAAAIGGFVTNRNRRKVVAGGGLPILTFLQLILYPVLFDRLIELLVFPGTLRGYGLRFNQF